MRSIGFGRPDFIPFNNNRRNRIKLGGDYTEESQTQPDSSCMTAHQLASADQMPRRNPDPNNGHPTVT